MPRTTWSRDWTVGVRVWIERAGLTVLGRGRAELLAAIGEHRSITKAAKAIKMSYRRAWLLIQEINEAAGEPLVESAVGGVQGGGAKLTERGRFALQIYEQVRGALVESAAGALQQAVVADACAAPCIHLAAAISLQEVVGQLLAEYALGRPTVCVRAVFGASNELADHVVAGAPCDLFISAERDEIDYLESKALLVNKSRRTVAINGLAWIGAKAGMELQRSTDVTKAKRIALADPACPLGRYSKAYLQSLGVYEQILPKLLHVDNSRGVPLAVASGAADIGLAFASDAARSNECHLLRRIPTAKASAEYVGAILRRGQHAKAATELLAFLRSRHAAQRFRRFGFRHAKP